MTNSLGTHHQARPEAPRTSSQPGVWVATRKLTYEPSESLRQEIYELTLNHEQLKARAARLRPDFSWYPQASEQDPS